MSQNFAGQPLEEIEQEIQDRYRADSWPWILGYSGGKDSTALVQLVWNSLSKLSQEDLFKPIYILSSDTMVEIPRVINHIDISLEQMRNAAAESDLPIFVEKVTPDIQKSFWVSLLGRGYPAPTSTFRWCTDRLKINPTAEFLTSKSFKASGAILLLGSRKSESAARKKRIEGHKVEGKRFNAHPDIPNTYVFTAIEDWETEEVWDYLLDTPSPWGADNKKLAQMYIDASDGECPLVLDIKGPSCGKSRFGCWCCTVVKKEKSLSSLVEGGEHWLAPLMELREILLETQHSENKKRFREHVKRTGQTYFIRGKLKEEGIKELGRGPYTMEFRKTFLRALLNAEVKINQENPHKTTQHNEYIHLVTPNEIHEIQYLWKIEKSDWENSAYQIYNEIIGSELTANLDEIGFLKQDDKRTVAQICESEEFPTDLALELLTVAQYHDGLRSQTRLSTKVAKTLEKEWRTEQEIYRDLQ